MNTRNCENRLAFELGNWLIKVPKPRSFLNGRNDNIRESELSEELADVVVPVKLSILGVINFQDAPKPGHDLNGDFSRIIKHYVGDEENLEGLDNAKLFGMDGENIKIIDFGESEVIGKVFSMHEKFAQALNAVSMKIKGLKNGKVVNLPS